MISKELFGKIRDNNGAFASWAIWEPQGEKPTSNMGPSKVFDLDANSGLLESLRNDVIMVALNFSRALTSPKPFANFHDEGPYAKDFKIRYAFKGTPFWGAYMTDALKDLIIPDAQTVRDYLKDNPEAAASHIRNLEDELDLIKSDKPTILAFGRDAYGILKKHLDNRKYSKLIQITHYSHQIKKEKYRLEVLEKITEHGGVI